MATPTLVGSATTATSSSTSYSCTKPTGVGAGHLLLSLQWSTVTIGATPAGWTQLQTQTGGATSRIAYLGAGGSEPGSYTFTQGGSGYGGAIIIAAAGASLGAPVSAGSAIASGAAVTTPSVVPAGAADLEVRFVCAPNTGGSFDPPSGFTARANVDLEMTGACATRVLASGAATGVHNFTCLGDPSAAPHGYTIAVTEAAESGRRIVVATFAAVHRAANW